MAAALYELPEHERESVVALFRESYRQVGMFEEEESGFFFVDGLFLKSLLGSSLCRLGGPAELPSVVGPGGLSLLFPLPQLS